MASITPRGKGPFTKALIGPVYLNDIWLGVQPPLPPSMELFSLLNNLLVNLPFSSWMCWNESTHSWWEEEIIRVTRNSWPISNWMWPPCVCVWGRGRIGVVLCVRERDQTDHKDEHLTMFALWTSCEDQTRKRGARVVLTTLSISKQTIFVHINI